MTPERWQRVKQIFDSALEYAPEQRSAFLSGACGGDDDLRSEVESLISSHEKTGTFIDAPAYEAAAHLIADETAEFKPGQVVGSYEIVSFISRGGMGEIYLAQDRRLNRKVALKILPVSFTRNKDRLRRFEQEARAASALNHPNIITIYEILKANSTHVIATEFVEGETLRQRLALGPMNLNQSLVIAIHVADALAAAHAAGIVHRDIKPENIMIRPDGYVKVLDFGLAKLAEQTAAVSAEEALTKQVRTGSGMIIGTAGYMSPEQARGKEVDARSDIFSLGTVIYETVTGRKPFDGETPSDTLAAILNFDPPSIADYLPQAPPELARILTKALRKDREERYQVVKDLLLDLKSLKEELDFQVKLDRSVSPSKTREATAAISEMDNLQPRAAPSSSSEIKTAVSTITHSLSAEIRRHKTGAVLAVMAIVVATVVAAFALYKFLNRSQSMSPGEPTSAIKPTQVTFSSGLDVFPSLSPDGNSIAYSSDQHGSFEIYVKQLTPGGSEIQLTSDGQQNIEPAWSPDGQRIAFSKNRGGIWVMPALGGSATQLNEFGSCPVWSRDGSMLAFQSGAPSEIQGSRALPPSTLWIVPSQGGSAKQVTQLENPPGGHYSPSWSPDGKHIAFGTGIYSPSSIWLVSIDGGPPKQIAQGGSPIYAPDGKGIYFVANSSDKEANGLSKIELSADGEPIGEPSRVISWPSVTSINSPTVSADGKRIAYSVTRYASSLYSIAMSSTNEAIGGPAPFAQDTSTRSVFPRFSRDGRRIVMAKFRSGKPDVWIADADGKNLTQLTTSAAPNNMPSWFPDGEKIAFQSTRDNKRGSLWSISLATRKEEQVLDLGETMSFVALSPDGEQVAFNWTKGGTINVWTAPLGGVGEKQLTFAREEAGFPAWSADGQWIAFELKHDEDNYLAIIPSGGGTPEVLVSDHGLSWPHSWSADGDKIVFAGRRNGIWNLYWVSRSTKQEKQLTHNTKLNAFVRYPAWSPLGNQIVYEYNETTGNIWLMELK
jgi:eukaryotic-like serine/threonine-protein kinase